MKKTYTAKQLSDAERLAQMLADIPADKRNITVMMVLFCKLNDAPVVTLNDAVTV